MRSGSLPAPSGSTMRATATKNASASASSIRRGLVILSAAKGLLSSRPHRGLLHDRVQPVGEVTGSRERERRIVLVAGLMIVIEPLHQRIAVLRRHVSPPLP